MHTDGTCEAFGLNPKSAFQNSLIALLYQVARLGTVGHVAHTD
jgi:hypothetical protein